jgi:O-methyltransferase involved in polyketide biosynthesis
MLFDHIDALSVAGSRLAVEAMPTDFAHSERLTRRREQMRRFREAVAKSGRAQIPDIVDLWYLEERTDVAEWLRAQGWDVSVADSDELLARDRRTVPDDVAEAMPPNRFVTARRPPRDIASNAIEGVS